MKQYGLSFAAALTAALMALLAWLWADPQGGMRNVAWQLPEPLAPELGEPITNLPVVQSMDTGVFMAILDRPLFSPSRRPVPKVVEVAKPPEVDPFAGIHLYGLYTADGDKGGILARVDGKVRRISAGEALGGWKIKEIQDRQVIFVRDGEERSINLAIARPGTPAAAPPRPPAATAAAAAQAPATPPTQPGDAQALRDEAQRELLRRRNELRAKAGAKILSE